jgi:hypothetical protein
MLAHSVLAMCAVWALLVPEQVRVRVIAGEVALANKPLFQEADLTRVGGFLTPSHADNEYSGDALAYYHNGTQGTLFMEVGFGATGPTRMPKVIQMSIPVAIDTSDGSTMNRASLVYADAVDITEGNADELHGSDPVTFTSFDEFRVYGMLVYDGRLIGSAYRFYDASNRQKVSHFAQSLNLGSLNFEGWKVIWDDTKARYGAGPMAAVPGYAQDALGGPVLTAGPPIASIISNLSVSHAAFTFNPAQITGRTLSTLTANALMYATLANTPHDNVSAVCEGAGSDHVGCDDDPSEVWNRDTDLNGIVIPTGYRTLLYFGVQGTGPVCYGLGTDDINLDGDPVPEFPEQHYCYNPAKVGVEGEHSYPYRYQVWAFDLLHLAQVKAGTRDPWNVQPYAYWELEFAVPAGADGYQMGGVAYDAANKAIYVAQRHTDPTTNFLERPIIWKFTHP